MAGRYSAANDPILNGLHALSQGAENFASSKQKQQQLEQNALAHAFQQRIEGQRLKMEQDKNAPLEINEGLISIYPKGVQKYLRDKVNTAGAQGQKAFLSPQESAMIDAATGVDYKQKAGDAAMAEKRALDASLINKNNATADKYGAQAGAVGSDPKQQNKDAAALSKHLEQGWAGRSGQAGQVQQKINAAQAAEALIEQGKAQKGGLDSRQIEELGQSTARMLGGNSVASARVEALVPKTAWGRAQSLHEWASNSPQGTDQQAFTDRMAETVRREHALADTQMKQFQIEGLPQFASLKRSNPDTYKAILSAKGIDPDTMIDEKGRYKNPDQFRDPNASLQGGLTSPNTQPINAPPVAFDAAMNAAANKAAGNIPSRTQPAIQTQPTLNTQPPSMNQGGQVPRLAVGTSGRAVNVPSEHQQALDWYKANKDSQDPSVVSGLMSVKSTLNANGINPDG